MDKVITYFKLAVAALVGCFTSLLGGWDAWLAALITLEIVDYITGIAKAAMNKSEKSASGGLNSTVMFWGGIRKILIFSIVAVATVIDNIISPESTTIRSMTIGYYVATEGLSIFENAAACGLPLPQKISCYIRKT